MHKNTSLHHLPPWLRLGGLLAILAAGVVLLAAPPVRAWDGEMQIVRSFPELTGDVYDAAWADWDNDGDLDLAVVQQYYTGGYGDLPIVSMVLENDGGVFSPAWQTPPQSSNTSCSWGDFNNDNLPDLVIGGKVTRIYRNTGNNMEEAWVMPDNAGIPRVAWGDVNGDGYDDLALSDYDRPLRLFGSDGSTLTLAWTAPVTVTIRSLAWADVDGDLDLDLAVGSDEGLRIYNNDGGVLSGAWDAPNLTYVYALDWADWDNDGDLDLAAGIFNWWITEGGVTLLINQTGSLAQASSSLEYDNAIRDLDWGDWDSDGDPDLAVINSGSNQVRIYENLPGGLALGWTSLPDSRPFWGAAVAWGDFDGDSDDDLFFGGPASDLLGNQEGLLQSGWTSPANYDAYALTWGDLDGDADLDLALGTDDAGLQIWHNQADALSLGWTAPGTDDVRAAAWGDLDNDGDLDLAAGTVGGPIRLYANNGGALSLLWSSPSAETTGALAWADFDRDGDLDLAAGGPGHPVRLYTNTSGNLALFWSAALSEQTTSLAWADYDGDNDLDLAVGSQGSPVRLYENSAGALILDWSAGLTEQTTSLAWGDWDNDGDQDLAVGNYGQPLRLYRNQTGAFLLEWSSPASDHSTSVKWADWDADGDLDLAAANFGEPNKVYANLGGDLIPLWAAPAGAGTRAIDWGDFDKDGDLDLAAANHAFQPLQVYLNQGDFNLAWSSLEQNDVTNLAWGDMDFDGDLDLAVSAGVYDQGLATLGGGFNRVYRRAAQGFELAWTSPVRDDNTAAAWADYDGDGDLDLSFTARQYNDQNMIRQGGFDRLYRNDSGAFTLAWTSPQAIDSSCLAWADIDQDGDLDLAVDDRFYPGRLYRNQGGVLTLDVQWTSWNINGLDWADYDEDGDPDLLVGAQLFPNLGGVFGAPLTLDIAQGGQVINAAFGDWDSDGDLDLGVSWDVEAAVFANNGGSFDLTWPFLRPYTYDLGFADWNLDFDLDAGLVFREASNTLSNTDIRIYTSQALSPMLEWSSPEIDLEKAFAWGDFDGDGDADLAAGSKTINYPTLNQRILGVTRVYENHANDAQALLDTAPRVRVRTPGGGSAPGMTGSFASAVILQGPDINIEYSLSDLESDPVRFIRAYFSLDGGGTWQPAVPASGTITENLAASPSGVSHTFTWDLFGSGLSGSSDNALFRIDAYQGFAGPGPYQYAYRWAASNPFRVRGSQVRVMHNGQPAAGAWVFRQPAASSSSYQPYRDLTGEPLVTSAGGYLLGSSQIAVGDHLAALAPITATHGYTLYYSSAAPSLTGITPYTVTQQGVQVLEVSAANPLLLLNLDVSLEWDARYDAQFLSRLEYDFQRTSELLFDWSNGQAALGQVRIYHNRQQWAEAHVQVYASNRMRPNAAQGGITDITLADPVDAEIEYQPGQVRIGAVWNRFGDPGVNLGEDWARALAHELGHYALYLDDNYLGFNVLGRLIPVDTCPGAMSDPYRDDYSEFHPLLGWLPACAATLSNQTTGRADWQTIQTFYSWLEGNTLNSGPSGLPLVVTGVDFINPAIPSTSLPVPLFYLTQDGHRLQPGASARAWLFSTGEASLTDLGRPNLDQVLARGASAGDRLCVFEPTQYRLGCELVQAGDEQLALTVLPTSLPEISLVALDTQHITVTVSGLENGLAVWARLYPADGSPVVSASLTFNGSGYSGVLNPLEPAPEGAVYVWVQEAAPARAMVTDYALGGSPARLRGRMAPAISTDGQVILFGSELDFPDGEFYSLQVLASLPGALPWTTPVGLAYRLLASPNAPPLSGASISFSYLGSEVPPGEESWLKIYYLDEQLASGWQVLPTTLDLANNHAVAPAQGAGLYALMSSLEIPLYQAGWNLFAYPVQATRPITEGLLSITGYFTTVYGYEGADLIDPWKMYDVTVPDWANDLHTLEFAHAYWIQTSQAITLSLSGAAEALEAPLNLFEPPSTFYGVLLPSAVFTPTAGMEVQARIDHQLCGQGLAREQQGQVVYTLNVPADGPEALGCGALGKTITFQAAGQILQPTASWTNGRVQALNLGEGITAPSAADDTFETGEDQSRLLDVLGNDSGEGLMLLAASPVQHGLVALVGDELRYTPAPDYFGADSFVYTVTNGSSLTDSALVSLNVTAINDAPGLSSLPDQAVSYGQVLEGLLVVLWDVDNLPDELQLTAESSDMSVIDPAHMLISSAGATRSLSLDPQQVGQALITLAVSDGEGTASFQFTLTVLPVQVYLPLLQRGVSSGR